MKCNEAEKWILLKDSSELATKHEGALVVHLHDCEACRRFQYALLKSQDGFKILAEPSETILDNIKREARRLAPEPKQAKVFYWKPALAMAATILIGLGIFFTTVLSDTVGLELIMTETELLDPQDQIVSVMYSGLSEEDLAFNFIMTYEEDFEG